MVSHAVLVLGSLVCVWAQLEPFSHSRALIGDAAAPVLVVLLGLALIGLDRRRPNESTDGEHGPAAWVRLAADKPGVAGVLVLAAVLGNAPLDAPNSAIGLAGFAWLAAGACRRITGGGENFAARLELLGGVGLFFASVLFAIFTGRSGLTRGPLTAWAEFGWGSMLLVPCLFLLLRSRLGHSEGEGFPTPFVSVFIALTIPMLFVFIAPVMIEIPRDLDFAVYAALPVAWLAFLMVGKLARSAAARGGRLVESSGAVRLGPWITIPTQAWCWILALQLATRVINPWESAVTFLLPLAALLLTIGVGVELLGRDEGSSSSSPIPGLERALIPLLAPTLAFAILHTVTSHQSWNADVAPRGQVALLLEALPVPLLGAALVVAFAIDRASGRAAHAAIATLGLALLGGCLMTLVDPVRFEPFTAWFGTPEQIQFLGARDVYGPVALLVAMSAGLCALRIVAAARGRRPSLRILVVPVVVAFAAACSRSPGVGPTAATWTAIVGLGVWLPLEAWSAMRSVPLSHERNRT